MRGIFMVVFLMFIGISLFSNGLAYAAKRCGNGICNKNKGENCLTCPKDCGKCPSLEELACGNGTQECFEECDTGASNGQPCIANYGETCSYCSKSCAITEVAGPFCGDRVKNGSEQCDAGGNNGQVCTPAYGEVCSYCSNTCQNVTVNGPKCGDGIMNGSEQCDAGSQNGVQCVAPYGSSCAYCSSSCAVAEIIGKYCGDNICDNNETCSICPKDCGVCPLACGDSICNGTETCSTCSGDCGVCPTINYKAWGFNFGPFVDEQDPNYGAYVSRDQMITRMRMTYPYTDRQRTFGSTQGNEEACNVAYELGFKEVYLGAWLSKNLAANATEIAALISQVKSCPFPLDNIRVIVGSEALLRNDLSENQLIAYIQQVRIALPGVQVTTGDVYSILQSKPKIIAAVDFIFANYYPYWEGIKLDYAVAAIDNWHDQLVAISGGKEVIVSEAGWPSCGNTIGDAVASPENAAFFFKNFNSWAKAKNVKYFYFEALDESWKAAYEGPQGACWGILDKYGVLKPGMQEVFDGLTMPDNWTCAALIDGSGTPSITFTYIPPYGSFDNLVGKASHISPREYKIAVYIKVGSGWWTKPYWNNPTATINCDGRWTTDITTGGYDQNATEIAAYLIPVSYSPPAAAGGGISAEIDSYAIAKISVTR